MVKAFKLPDCPEEGENTHEESHYEGGVENRVCYPRPVHCHADLFLWVLAWAVIFSIVPVPVDLAAIADPESSDPTIPRLMRVIDVQKRSPYDHRAEPNNDQGLDKDSNHDVCL